MENAVLLAVAVVAIVAGALLGYFLAVARAPERVKAARAEAEKIVAEARERQKALILEAKDEQLRLQRESDDEARARRGELTNLERRLLARGEQLDPRTEKLEARRRERIE